MDQSLPPMSPSDNSPEPLFKNPLVIIALIIFIVALVMAGLGWWLKTNNLIQNNANQSLTEAEQLKLLKELQTSASSTPELSNEEQSKLLKELQTSDTSAPQLSNEEQLKLLKSLQQQ